MGNANELGRESVNKDEYRPIDLECPFQPWTGLNDTVEEREVKGFTTSRIE